jgi:hypothetical protein
MVLLEFLSFCAKEFANENRDFYLLRYSLSFHNLLAAAFLISFSLSLPAQQPPSNSVDVQREAMRRLSFLAGYWSGPSPSFADRANRFTSPRRKISSTSWTASSSELQVALCENRGNRCTNVDGKILFSALATIAYDDASHTYRFRAYNDGYNDGHYLDTELMRSTDSLRLPERRNLAATTSFGFFNSSLGLRPTSMSSALACAGRRRD